MLFSLTSDDDSRAEIVKLGGVPLLCNLLKSKNPNVQKNACGALLNLAGDDEAREEIIKCGAAIDFVKLLVDGTDILKEYAAGVYVNLANDNEAKQVFFKGGGTKPLAKLLKSGETEKIRCSVGAFGTLVTDSNICKELRDLDGFQGVVDALQNEDEDIVIRTSGALWNICVDSEESIKALIDADCINLIIPILSKASEPELIINTGMVLSLLAGIQEGSDKLIKERGMKCLMNILKYDDDQIRNNGAAIVWNLGHVKENKEEMAKYEVGKYLSDFLDSRDPDTIEKTLGATVTSGSNIEIATQFREAEGIEKLIPFLENHKYEKVTLYSIICIAVLAVHDENKDAVREAGGLGPLIDILTQENLDFIEKSLAAQLNLSLNAKNRTAMRQLDAIPPLIDLLFHENPNIQQNAAGVLWNLANDERNKKLIREMGGLNALLALISGGKIDDKDRNAVDKQKKK